MEDSNQLGGLEVFILMRNIEKNDKFTINSEGVIDEGKLAKSFVMREFHF